MEVKQKAEGRKQKAKACLIKKSAGTVQMPKDLRVTVTVVLLSALYLLLSACQQKKDANDHRSDYVSLIENDSLTRLDVFIDGKYFSSYLYADSILRKPVLFPLTTASEVRVTRGYPFAPNAGERIDHPHHYGLWFNHGDVNGIDFWNSSLERKKGDPRYGSINHVKFLKKESGNKGTLEVEKEWRSSTDTLVLSERTQYLFSGDANRRIITHTTTLTAREADVLFTDSKEGMFAMRVRRELEIPADDSTVLLTENLIPSSEVVSKEGVSGHYRNSNGLEGYPAVWGKRAKWMQLTGIVNNDSISICIFDYPENLNHPPHWMARDYGLYSVNPMGSKLYTEGKEQLNFKLKRAESVTFTHQVVIIDGKNPAPAKIEAMYNEFVTSIKSQ